jgi:dienelactone hydrolase
MKGIWIVAILSGALWGQALEVVPPRVLPGEAAAIRAKGLQPNERITVRAELVDGGDHKWKSEADFVADGEGSIDASRQPAVGGAYKDVNGMGLIWFMMPEGRQTAMYRPQRTGSAQVIEFSLWRKSSKLAEARLEQVSLAPGEQRIPVHEDGLRGALFVPAGGEEHPAVLVVGGSNGGAPELPAAWLAAHGFVALALAYFNYEDLPKMLEGIPLEYFQRGLGWLLKRPEVSGDRAAVMGTSRGGELALQLGSMFPAIRAVVAYVPADVRYPACCGNTSVPYAWTWTGRPLPYALPRFGRTGEAAIEVERTRGPVLMISGEDDHLWRSWEMADAVVSRLKRANFAYSFENLKYAHAGHLAGHPSIRPAWHTAVRHPISGRLNDLGGSAKGDAESSIDSMPKVLEFLRKGA